ncbi:MAG: hypothetical protein ACR2G6_12380 [Gemmatimonadaceae bacterium]
MFVRIFRRTERKEVLFNVNHVSRIDVEYAAPGSDGNDWSTTLQTAYTTPEPVRYYKVHVGGEVFNLRSNPDDPVMKVFEDVYKNAIKT